MATKEQDLIIKIRAETAKAEKQVKDLTKQVKTLETQAKKTSKQTIVPDKVTQGFSNLKKTLIGVVAGFGALGVAIKAVEFAKLASQAEQSADAFEKVFTDMGLVAEEEFQKIKDASQGLLSDQAIKQSATVAVSLGVPIEKLAGLMEVARVKAREMGTEASTAFNDLAVGIGRGSPMILDNLGLTIKLEEANNKYADSVGKTVEELSKSEKQLALTNAVLEAGADSVERFADAGLSSEQQFQLMNAQLENMKVEIGKGVLPLLLELADATTKWVKSIDPETMKGVGSAIASVGDALIGIIKSVGWLNDHLLPDYFYGKDAGVFDEAIKGWKNLGDWIEYASDKYDQVFKSADKIYEIANQADAFRTASEGYQHTAESLDILEKNIIKTYESNQKLLKQWRDSGVDGYAESIQRVSFDQLSLAESLEKVREKKSVFEDLKTSAEEYEDSIKTLTKDEAEEYQKFNEKRIKDHQATLKTLLANEAELSKDIIKINNELAKEFERIGKARFDNAHTRGKAIADLEVELLHEVKQYGAKEELEAEALANAKEALKKKEYDQYKRYIADYESYAMASADKVANAQVEIDATAKQTAQNKIDIHKQIQKLNEQLYASEEQDALAVHNRKVEQHNAELALIKLKIEAEKSLIQLVVDFVNQLTDKTFELDTSDVDDFISKMGDAQQKIITLDETKPVIEIDDQKLDQTKQKIVEVKQETATPILMTIEARDGTKEVVDLAKTNVENTKAELEITTKDSTKAEVDAIEQREEATPIEKDLVVDLNEKSKAKVDQELSSLEEPTESEHTIDVDNSQTDDAKISNVVNTISMHDIGVDNSETASADAQNKIDTWSYHTIYVKEVSASGSAPVSRANGGAVPQRLATGGTFTGSGRVAGYDPSDSDGVNAKLTGGEYVIKRKAVDLYGLAFLNALNGMRLPKVKGYAQGGLVSNKSPSTAQLHPINLNFNDKSFALQGDSGVALELQSYFESKGGM